MMRKELLEAYQGEKALAYISKYVDVDCDDVLLVKTNEQFNIENTFATKKAIVNLHKINDIRSINEFFKVVNSKLNNDGIFIGCVETKDERRKRLFRKYPFLFAQIYFLFDFIFKRVFSKLWFTKWFYFFITAGRNQVLSKAESLGRLVYCGFEIIDEQEINNLLYFTVKKKKYIENVKEPMFSILFKMVRIGKYGNPITVYKIRTMHPYAEFLQDYIYKKNNLAPGGKFKDDFRVTTWGKVLRKLWIDELPMLFNVFIGQLKLVGVRPLSKQYLSLYDKDLVEKRKEVKPGLVPPYYADLPKSLPEIMASELNYINQYKEHPVITDFKYFFKATSNILFKKVRSS